MRVCSFMCVRACALLNVFVFNFICACVCLCMRVFVFANICMCMFKCVFFVCVRARVCCYKCACVREGCINEGRAVSVSKQGRLRWEGPHRKD